MNSFSASPVLTAELFISAASFPETTRVLTEASISRNVDHLRGLKTASLRGTRSSNRFRM